MNTDRNTGKFTDMLEKSFFIVRDSLERLCRKIFYLPINVVKCNNKH